MAKGYVENVGGPTGLPEAVFSLDSVVYAFLRGESAGRNCRVFSGR